MAHHFAGRVGSEVRGAAEQRSSESEHAPTPEALVLVEAPLALDDPLALRQTLALRHWLRLSDPPALAHAVSPDELPQERKEQRYDSDYQEHDARRLDGKPRALCVLSHCKGQDGTDRDEKDRGPDVGHGRQVPRDRSVETVAHPPPRRRERVREPRSRRGRRGRRAGVRPYKARKPLGYTAAFARMAMAHPWASQRVPT
jgi:hypothetical protein